MIRIEFTNEQGTTVTAQVADDRLEEVAARAQVRIFGEPTAEATAAEAKRWLALKAKWAAAQKGAKQ